MAKRNALMARMEEQSLRYARAARMLEVGFCTDIAVIALGRLGWGEKRLTEFEAAFSAAYEEYDDLREEDGSADREQAYYKACLDREIRRYVGTKFVPFDERHPGLKGGGRR